MLLILCALLSACGSRERAPEPGPETPAEQQTEQQAESPVAGSEFGLAAEGTAPAHNIAMARGKQREQLFQWQPWSRETFERARAEGRHILLHCAAVWCHWCHVMEETTYLDPEVGAILRDRFVTIRVDIDERPDIAERYGDWGWPATVIYNPRAEELGKYRGYLSVDEMRSALTSVGDRQVMRADDERKPGHHSPARAAMPWIARSMTLELDDYYDPQEGSWGFRQKVPLGENAYFEGARVVHGDRPARGRLKKSLDGHARLIDPVWGGIYQYSTGGDWGSPHYEKLMTYQAANIMAFTRGFHMLKDRAYLDHGKRIADYVARFLTSEQGTFYVTQDADVGTHDRSQRFVDGKVYYARDEAGRLALGVPWVDDHVYAYENGLMIVALVALHIASREQRYLDRAERAADALIGSHLEPAGTVRHDAKSASRVRHLADSAGLGRALARLANVGSSEGKRARYRRDAERIAAAMDRALFDASSGAYYGHTPDSDAAGVFIRRRHPFEHNVLAARFLAQLARATGDEKLHARAQQVLIAIATPHAVADQGRMLGAFLSALDEADLYPWPKPGSIGSDPR